MELAFYLNSTLLFLTVSYGISFGIKNWFKRFISLFKGSDIRQSQLGKILDGMFLTAVIYFFTLGSPFIQALRTLY